MLLGLDAGGTKTLCLLADAEGKVLGRGVGGPGNPRSAGRETAAASFEEAIQKARAAAGLSSASVAAVCAGAAGVGRTEEREWLERYLARLCPGAEVAVVTDLVVAFAGALRGEPGAVVISGTGSSAFAASRDGRTARAGGFGSFLSDEGSGFAIVRAALAAVLRAHDGRDGPTALTDALLAAFRLSRPEDLVSLPQDASALAARFPVVLEQSRVDPKAHEILVAAGKELALMAATALSRVGLAEEPVQVARCGGVLATQGPHLVFFTKTLSLLSPSATVVAPAGDAAEGALLIARRKRLGLSLLDRLLRPV